jgi:Dolichyl-phosphate-mannose-protein mannosyltransferase
MTIKVNYLNRKTQIALSLISLITAFLLLNLKTLGWSFAILDSPILLAQAILYSPIEYFTSPYKYQFMSYGNLTPWSSLSWDIDYNLFQLEPFGFRAHQLASLAAMMGIVYLILYRLTHSIVITSVFCFAIMTLPATFSIGDDLTCRHYLEGMIFSLLSFYFAGKYNEDQQLRWWVFSVLVYVFSITAKEIYIPLPGILFFYFSGNFRRKILLIFPYAVALLAYLIWRYYMLDGFGGYKADDAASLHPGEHPLSLANIGSRLLTSWLGNPVGSLLALAFCLLVLAVNFRKLDTSVKFGIFIGALGLLLPILALVPTMAWGIFDSRWLFAVSVAILLLLAYLCSTTESKILTAVVYVVILASSMEALYLRVIEPTPPYSAGNQGYKDILQSDPNHYLRFSTKSEALPSVYKPWVYLAKLHNGTWGTLTISESGQLRYHDIGNRTALPFGPRKNSPENVNTAISTDLNLVESASFDSKSGLLTFNFVGTPKGERCFVYIFGPDNGLLYRGADCRQWAIDYRGLKYMLRVSGYELPETSIAVWSENTGNRFYSRPVRMNELIDIESL